MTGIKLAQEPMARKSSVKTAKEKYHIEHTSHFFMSLVGMVMVSPQIIILSQTTKL